MKKATVLCLNSALLLFGVVLGLAFSIGRAGQSAGAEKSTPGAGVMWNGTDYNSSYSQSGYPGPQDVFPRIIVEYADCAVMNTVASGGSNVTLAPRILVEYVDCLVTSHMRNAYDLNGDHKCNMRDIAVVAKAFGLTADSPNWNEAYDVNGDFKVDMKDIGSWTKHYGEAYT